MIKALNMIIQFNVSEDKEVEMTCSYSVSYFGNKIPFTANIVIDRKMDGHIGWKTLVRSENIFPKFQISRIDVDLSNIEIYHPMTLTNIGQDILFFPLKIIIPISGKMKFYSNRRDNVVELAYNVSNAQRSQFTIELECIYNKDVSKVKVEYQNNNLTFRDSKGQLSGKYENFNYFPFPPYKISMKLKGRQYLQLETLPDSSLIHGKYSVYGGSVARGMFRVGSIKSGTIKIEIREDKWKLPGKQRPKMEIMINKHAKGLLIESRKNNILLWSYSFDKIKLVSSPEKFEMEVRSRLEISPSSALYKAMHKGIGNIYRDLRSIPQFWFDKTRSTRFYILVEHGPTVFPKVKSTFRFENDVGGLFDIKIDSIRQLLAMGVKLAENDIQLSCHQNNNGKDGRQVRNSLTFNEEETLRLDVDTEEEMDENKFSVFSKLDYLPLQQTSAGLTATYRASHGNNKKIEITAAQSNEEVCNYMLDSKMTNNSTKSVLSLNDTLYFHQADFLEKKVVSLISDRDFLKFNEQKSRIYIQLNKESEEVLAKGEVKKDGKAALDFSLDTKNDPIDFRLNTAGRTDSFKSMGITLNHRKGQYIELKYDSPFFKGFRINQLHGHNELVWNEKSVGPIYSKGELGQKLKTMLDTWLNDLFRIWQENSIDLKHALDHARMDRMLPILMWMDMTLELQVFQVGFYLETSPDNYIRLLSPFIPVLVLSDLME
eukprot:GFUD01014699.1.p1 GENE.GFUD01014699.1~~GFUD01014699.1.p1  ORF type:complete len:817 (-),score=120.10 GFUD01014699.1:175-2316(-)